MSPPRRPSLTAETHNAITHDSGLPSTQAARKPPTCCEVISTIFEHMPLLPPHVPPRQPLSPPLVLAPASCCVHHACSGIRSHHHGSAVFLSLLNVLRSSTCQRWCPSTRIWCERNNISIQPSLGKLHNQNICKPSTWTTVSSSSNPSPLAPRNFGNSRAASTVLEPTQARAWSERR